MTDKKTRSDCKYNESFDEVAKNGCKDFGYDDEGLATLFGVSRRTIQTWKKNFPSFGIAIREGKDEFDTVRVEQTLLKRAMGYEYEEIKTDSRGRTITTKEVAPDPTCLIFWLKNRNTLRWRDVRNVNIDMGKELERHVFVVPDFANFDDAVTEQKKEALN